jgi:putative membrane protein
MVPEHTGHGADALSEIVLLSLVISAGVYAGAAFNVRERQGWSWWRVLAWVGAMALVLVSVTGRLGQAAALDFRAHVITHLLLAQAVPLLLVAAAPVTLLLRALPVGAARRVTWLLGTRPLGWLTEPVVAAVLSISGLWVLYGTPVYALSQSYGWLHLLVHAHLLITGYLLTTSLVGRDPMPHRRSHGYRAGVLVALLAAHAIVARSLYAVPPVGVPAAQAEDGAMIMYYGSDALSLVLIVWLCADWYHRRKRSVARAAASASAVWDVQLARHGDHVDQGAVAPHRDLDPAADGVLDHPALQHGGGGDRLAGHRDHHVAGP